MSQDASTETARGVTGPSASGTNRLPRVLTVFGGVLLTLSCVTPASSLFIAVPELISSQGTGVVLTLLLSVVISMGAAFCYSELGTCFPNAGGEYTIVGSVLGRGAGWLTFAMSLLMVWLLPPTIALGTADYLTSVVHLSQASTGAAVMLVATCTALLDVRSNSVVTGIFLGIEVVAAALVAVFGFANAHRPLSSLFHLVVPDGGGGSVPLTFGTLMTGLAVGMFTFQGFGSAVYLSEELRDPRHNVARTVISSLLAASVITVVPTAAAVVGAPHLSDLAHADFTALTRAWGGPALATFVSLAVAAAILNAVIVMVLQNARVLYSSARDRAWPTPVNDALSRLHPRFQSPWLATLLVGLPGAVLALTVDLETLLGLSGVIVAVVYLLLSVAALRSRRLRQGRTGWQMPLWPGPAVLTVAALVFALFEQDAPDLLVTGGVLLVAGIYYLVHLRRRASTHWVMTTPDSTE